MGKQKIHIAEDVEKVVNDPERQATISAFYRKRKAKRQRKILFNTFAYMLLALAIFSLGFVGWMYDRLAYPLSIAVLMYSAFLFGRWFENGKFARWH